MMVMVMVMVVVVVVAAAVVVVVVVLLFCLNSGFRAELQAPPPKVTVSQAFDLSAIQYSVARWNSRWSESIQPSNDCNLLHSIVAYNSNHNEGALLLFFFFLRFFFLCVCVCVCGLFRKPPESFALLLCYKLQARHVGHSSGLSR